MNYKSELMKVVKEAENLSAKIANDILDAVDEFDTPEGDVEMTSAPASNRTKGYSADKQATPKKAALINEGNRIVCVNPIQGIYKGRIYVCGGIPKPGFLTIIEEDGSEVGIFAVNRFLLDNSEY